MRVFATIVALAMAGPLFSQQLVTKSGSAEFDPEEKYQKIVREDGSTLPQAHGVWRASGYGYLTKITDSDVKLLSETSACVWEENDRDASSGFLIKFDKSGQMAHITEHRLVPPFVVQRIERLPESYQPGRKWTPQQRYVLFESNMTEYYAFFKERSFDWPEKVIQVRPTVVDTMTETELFDAMQKTLLGLEDAHTQLAARIDGELHRTNLGQPKSMRLLMEAFANQDEFAEFEPFLQSKVAVIGEQIAKTVLMGNPNQTCESLVWGKTINNVGYLFIPSMSGFADTDDLEVELEALHDGLDQILNELADTRALIVDITTNGGGSDIYSVAIASHFADQRRLAFTKGPSNEREIEHSIYIQPYKNADGQVRTYAKPVYLATNDFTVSAAEIFVLCMKDFPHVTTIGQTTRGSLSDILAKTLPNGWQFGLSNEIYRDSQGVCFEATGIPPEVSLTIVDPKQRDFGHAAAILKIAKQIK
jgi:carboxyl-terminal processing protease